ncbi:MAG: Uma2 family endonuclease [Epsilonproteobacteria bacterium]|nr:Uma2 family endonuclease [Campylobacterota bacterium]NPA64574.1 Uma2 family endonuclease [Campylobacterota bacterium]
MCAIEYYTYEDYKQWEGDWELIYGQPVAMAPSPMITHQAIAFEIAYQLRENLECEECLVVLEEDWIVEEDTVVRPDVSLICDEEGDFITKAPHIVVEVVCPQTARRDEKIKFEIYEKEKVPYYILVYPRELKAKVYKLIDGRFDKVADFTNERYEFDLPCSTAIDFSKAFKKFRKKK